MKTFRSKVQKVSESKASLREVLLKLTKLDEKILADAASKGAVWLQKGNGKILRERSLTTTVLPQDTVSLFYDPRVLKLPSLTDAQCLFENENYGIWFKPAGVVPQGTQSGDHSSLLRFIELKKKKEIYLIHRLDRETAGLMVFAYHSKAAALLSELFQKNLIKKEYEAIVLGSMERGLAGKIDVALDDKKAVTFYEVIENNSKQSLLRISIETGRLHQIRRHLDHIGHPVMGDPKYGKGNKNKAGMQLLARTLSFQDPWTKKLQTQSWNEPLTLEKDT